MLIFVVYKSINKNFFHNILFLNYNEHVEGIKEQKRWKGRH